MASERTGYACEIEALVNGWRAAFHAEHASPPLPFGVVTLAGGTDEGQPYNMPSMRYAQTANQGYLPSPNMPGTFSAAAHDLGDPCSQLQDDGYGQPGDGRCCSNALVGGGGWPCTRGAGPHTPQYMGSLHPRIKSLVGSRLAKAARSIAYGKSDEPFTGPVLESCTVGIPTDSSTFPNITLRFKRDLLMNDAVMVNDPMSQSLELADPISGWSMGNSAARTQLLASLGTGSPLQVELNGNFTHTGSWLPVKATAKCQAQHYDVRFPNRSTCYVDRDTWTKQAGYDEVVVQIGLDPFTWVQLLAKNVTGIRYAWGTNPCCPSTNRNNVGCPPASCPIQSFNSSLPAVPFWASISNGSCAIITTHGAPPKGFKEHADVL